MLKLRRDSERKLQLGSRKLQNGKGRVRVRKTTVVIASVLLILAFAIFTSGQANAQGGTWSTKTSMPSDHYSFGSGVVNGIIYAVGGDSGSFNVGTMEAYDPALDAWTTKAPMPTARAALGVGVVNGTLYAVGGSTNVDGCGDLSVVEAYDPVTNTWTTRAPMTTTQSHLGVGVVNGILYAVGGHSGSSAPNCANPGATVATLQAYDPASDTWTTKTPMSTARYDLMVGVVNGILYAVGGSTNSNTINLSTMEAYDPASDTWTTKAPMPFARSSSGSSGSVGVINGILYAVGGATETGLVATSVAYDPATDTWTEIAPIPTPRVGLSDSVVGNVLYALGGANASGVLATNEAFTVLPQTKADCMNGGWQTFGFENQGQCIKFVNHQS
jgi:hypothetical protein